jgi:hypothetical protein
MGCCWPAACRRRGSRPAYVLKVRATIRLYKDLLYEQVEQVPALAPRPDGVFRLARSAPVGPTHAVDTADGRVACGIAADRLEVLDDDWEAACFVEKCPGCFAVVVAHG